MLILTIMQSPSLALSARAGCLVKRAYSSSVVLQTEDRVVNTI